MTCSIDCFPKEDVVEKLSSVFDEFASKEFSSLREQLSTGFEATHDAFWLEIKKKQKTLFGTEKNVSPSKFRVEFDVTVCHVLGVRITKDLLFDLYKILAQEMIVTRGLTRN